MNCKTMTTPMALNRNLLSVSSSKLVDATMYHQMIISLMCVTNTILDTCFGLNELSQFLRDPILAHLVAKHAVRYLKGTVEYGLKYETNQKINLEGYMDSYWAESSIDRKSTSRCYFSMRSGVISWFSKKESCMALSTAEAKYVATCLDIWEVVCFF